jgi:hypothetical protein
MTPSATDTDGDSRPEEMIREQCGDLAYDTQAEESPARIFRTA